MAADRARELMADEGNVLETSPLSPLCAACGAKLREAKFCPECGTQADCGPASCAACGTLLEGGPKFCPECGAAQPTASPAPSA